MQGDARAQHHKAREPKHRASSSQSHEPREPTMPDGEDKLVRSARRRFHQRREKPKSKSSLRRYRAVFIEL
jgi:hypothetical protein